MIKVLLADDQPILVDGLQSLLEKEQEIEVVAAALNGQQVLHALETTKVDVAVLDIEMPQMDGIETTRAIRKTYPKVKVLILTMYDKPEFIQQLFKVGAHGYILKNRNKSALVSAIHAVYRGHGYYPPEIADKMHEASEVDLEEIRLTQREKDVLRLIGRAFSAKEISTELGIGEKTAISHIKNLRHKLKVHNVQGLVRYAIKFGYAEL